MIRVGRTVYDKKGKRTDPSFEGFTNIVVLMKSHSKWGPLSPYYLKNEKGVIMENYWQFSKIYDKIPDTTQYFSRYNNKITWTHGEECHVKDGKLTQEYYNWRKKGMKCKYAIRYPVGYKYRTKCLYALANKSDGTIDESDKLDYIQSRKKIYVPEYCRLVKSEKRFKELKTRLAAGENLLIIEVDGPHQESLDYYKTKYSVSNNFIQNNTMLINKNNIKIMLNDPKHPFGHGYCLAMALLDKAVTWNK